MPFALSRFLVFLFGVAFGFVLSRGGATDYNFIQKMFLFQDFQLYGIIMTAVIVTAPLLYLLKRHGKTITGEPLSIRPKPFHYGNIIGGAFFGIGWAITGMCPGPIFVNLGEGKLYALGALVGALLGTELFARLYSYFQRPFRLPALDEGTGCG
jgi:uncharacterized membrane protein YedE/YeeE